MQLNEKKNHGNANTIQMQLKKTMATQQKIKMSMNNDTKNKNPADI
jgi:hypothetical protein